jgi:hypothetical protein
MGIFVPEGEKGTGGRRKLRNEEVQSLYHSVYIVRIMKWVEM